MSSEDGFPFTPDKALINPKFEGYRLGSLDQDDCVSSFLLPRGGASQVTGSNSTHAGLHPQLSFKEVQDRIAFNHLSAGLDGVTLGYIDKDGMAILVRLGQDGKPHFTSFFEIPKIIQGPHTLIAEYPCLQALDRDTWIISDGKGNLYIVKETTAPSESSDPVGVLLAAFSVPHDDIDEPTTPMRLHVAHTVQPSDVGGNEITIRVLISHKVVKEQDISTSESGRKQKARSHHKIQFRLSAISLQLPRPVAEDAMDEVTGPRNVSVLWSAIGDDLPAHVRYSPRLRSYLILAESAYIGASSIPSATTSLPPRDPLPEEIAPIPRAQENLDAEKTPIPPSIPPYSWTQNEDSLTIAFFLPVTIPKTAIRATLRSRDLSLLIIDTTGSLADAKNMGLKIPFFAKKPWWGEIDASASLWTWDKDGDREYAAASGFDAGGPTIGVLTLYLEKRHEKTRWPHVFASSGTTSTDGRPPDDEDSDVPETLDPTELYAAREALEKYTSAVLSGEDPGGLDLGRGLPSLSRKEVDDEIDDNVGRSLIMMWREADDGVALLPPGGYEWPLDLLSHPVPLPLPDHDAKALGAWSIIIKNGVDGLLFNCDDASVEGKSPAWKHDSTFSALAFVLASKRDTRFTFHLRDKVVVAFESGAASPIGGGNAYVYRGIDKRGAKWAKQAVLKVGVALLEHCWELPGY
ncbi:uncharacterized protein EI90DRAFT_3156380 [Cantharellus anzutake]|uniref:uncharacterized protein n=1 Tax=Cantharellus anzutake TaxID=1750568 RepID=UPI0019085C0F|nr:uncharacterized protein EI90DRAFT_3156380 [Cantharellus anzutake]KAF8327023.1 hypothetical protein EI90DRAFT_3156380 [Cantharellus anzutake]